MLKAFALKAIIQAKVITGKAVPNPYNEGISRRESCFAARPRVFPKKSAADIGQKARAKIRPRRKAPHNPLLARRTWAE